MIRSYGRSNTKHGSQRGYTFVELIVIIGMIGFISGIFALTYDMVVKQSIVNKGWSTAVSQVDEAGRWISRDVQSAADITSWSSTEWQCGMIRYEWSGSSMDNVTVSYVIDEGKLYRRINGVQPGAMIAQFIDVTGNSTNFNKLVSGGITTYILNVRAMSDNVHYAKQYRIYPRAAN